MKIDEINAAVAAFREQEMPKIHATINSAHPWRKDELAADGMRALDVRAERYRRSLGLPDDPQADESPAPVMPGVK